MHLRHPSLATIGAPFVAAVLTLTACASEEQPVGDEPITSDADAPASDSALVVEVEDGALWLHGPDDARRELAAVSLEDGELVHAAVRPGDHGDTVVLTLFRVEGPEPVARYELRYLTVGDDGPSELYWFPWRLQVDARTAEVLDVPPVPVWSPDGDALAWIEWNGTETMLRIVGWHEDGANPSDQVSAFRLTEVDEGTQLEAWEGDSTTVLSARSRDGERLEIELSVSDLAMSRGDA